MPDSLFNSDDPTQDALRRREEELRATFDSIPLPTYAWARKNDDFVLVDYNRAAYKTAKGYIEKILGIKVTELYKDASDIIQDFNQCYQERTTITREMQYFFQSLNETRYVAAHYAYVSEERMLVTVEDIHDRKLIEQEIRQLNEKLEQRVTERTAELKAANEELRQFAHIISHDLRTPLVNLKGYSQEITSSLKLV